MIDNFIPPVSIEKFAAYLDGNLSQNEMNEVSSRIENDVTLKYIFEDADSIGDLSLESFDMDAYIYMPDGCEYSLDNIRIPTIEHCGSNDMADSLDSWFGDDADVSVQDDIVQDSVPAGVSADTDDGLIPDSVFESHDEDLSINE